MENAAEAAPQPQRNATNPEDEEGRGRRASVMANDLGGAGGQGEELTGGRDNDAHNEEESTRDQPQGAEVGHEREEGRMYCLVARMRVEMRKVRRFGRVDLRGNLAGSRRAR